MFSPAQRLALQEDSHLTPGRSKPIFCLGETQKDILLEDEEEAAKEGRRWGMGEGRMDGVCLKGQRREDSLLEERHNCSQIKLDFCR